MVHADDIGTIVGLSVGGLFIFICSPTIFITLVACVVYHNSTKSGQTTIITHPTTTTIRGGTDTGAGGASDQPGFQLQKLGNCVIILL